MRASFSNPSASSTEDKSKSCSAIYVRIAWIVSNIFAINSVLSGARNEYERLMANPSEIDAVLARGAEHARKVAQQTMARVKKAMLG